MRKPYNNVSKEQTGTVVLVEGGDDYKDYKDDPAVKNVPKRDTFTDHKVKASKYKWPRHHIQNDSDIDLLIARVPKALAYTSATDTVIATSQFNNSTIGIGEVFKAPKRSVAKFEGLFDDDSEPKKSALSGREDTTGIWRSFKWPGEKNENEDDESTGGTESEGTTIIWRGFNWPESVSESGIDASTSIGDTGIWHSFHWPHTENKNYITTGLSHGKTTGAWQEFNQPKAHATHDNEFTSTVLGLPESNIGIESNSEVSTGLRQGPYGSNSNTEDNAGIATDISREGTTGIWQGFNWPSSYSEHTNEFTSTNLGLPESHGEVESNSEESTDLRQGAHWPNGHTNDNVDVATDIIHEDTTGIWQGFNWPQAHTEDTNEFTGAGLSHIGIEANSEESSGHTVDNIDIATDISYEGTTGIWQGFNWPEAHSEVGNEFTSTGLDSPESHVGIESNSEEFSDVRQGSHWPNSHTEGNVGIATDINYEGTTGVWQGFNWPESHSEVENEFTSAGLDLPESHVGIESNSEEFSNVRQGSQWPSGHTEDTGISHEDTAGEWHGFNWPTDHTEDENAFVSTGYDSSLLQTNVRIESNSEETTGIWQSFTWPESETGTVTSFGEKAAETGNEFHGPELHTDNMNEIGSEISTGGISESFKGPQSYTENGVPETTAESFSTWQDFSSPGSRVENLNNEGTVSNSKGSIGGSQSFNENSSAETRGKTTNSFLARILKHQDKLNSVGELSKTKPFSNFANTEPYLHNHWEIFSNEGTSSLGHNGYETVTKNIKNNHENVETTVSGANHRLDSHPENELMTKNHVAHMKVDYTSPNPTESARLEYSHTPIRNTETSAVGNDEESSSAFVVNLEKNKDKLNSLKEATPTIPEPFVGRSEAYSINFAEKGSSFPQHDTKSGHVTASDEHITESEIAAPEVEHHTENEGAEIKVHYTESGGVETGGVEAKVEHHTEHAVTKIKEHLTKNEGVGFEGEYRTELAGEAEVEHHTTKEKAEDTENGVEPETQHTESEDVAEGEHHTENDGTEMKTTNSFLSEIADIAQKLSSVDREINTATNVLYSTESSFENNNQNDADYETEGKHYTEYSAVGDDEESSSAFVVNLEKNKDKLNSPEESTPTVPEPFIDRSEAYSTSFAEEGSSFPQYDTKSGDINATENEGAEIKVHTESGGVETEEVEAEVEHHAEHAGDTVKEHQTKNEGVEVEGEHRTELVGGDAEIEHHTKNGKGEGSYKESDGTKMKTTNIFISEVAEIAQKLSSVDKDINTAPSVLHSTKSSFENSNQNGANGEIEGKHTEYEGPAGEHNTLGAEVKVTNANFPEKESLTKFGTTDNTLASQSVSTTSMWGFKWPKVHTESGRENSSNPEIHEATTVNPHVNPGAFTTLENHKETYSYVNTQSEGATSGFWQSVFGQSSESTVSKAVSNTISSATTQEKEQNVENKNESSLEHANAIEASESPENQKSSLSQMESRSQVQNIQPTTQPSSYISHSTEVIVDKYPGTGETSVFSHLDNSLEILASTVADENVVKASESPENQKSSLSQMESESQVQNIQPTTQPSSYIPHSTEVIVNEYPGTGETSVSHLDNSLEILASTVADENVVKASESPGNQKSSLSQMESDQAQNIQPTTQPSGYIPHSTEVIADEYSGTGETSVFSHLDSSLEILASTVAEENVVNVESESPGRGVEGKQDIENHEEVNTENVFHGDNIEQNLSSLLAEVDDVIEKLHESETQVDEETLHAAGSENDINIIDDFSLNTNNEQKMNTKFDMIEDFGNSKEMSTEFSHNNNNNDDTDTISTTLSNEEEELNSILAGMDKVMQELHSNEEQITRGSTEMSHSGVDVDNKNEYTDDNNSRSEASEEQSTNTFSSKFENDVDSGDGAFGNADIDTLKHTVGQFGTVAQKLSSVDEEINTASSVLIDMEHTSQNGVNDEIQIPSTVDAVNDVTALEHQTNIGDSVEEQDTRTNNAESGIEHTEDTDKVAVEVHTEPSGLEAEANEHHTEPSGVETEEYYTETEYKEHLDATVAKHFTESGNADVEHQSIELEPEHHTESLGIKTEREHNTGSGSAADEGSVEPLTRQNESSESAEFEKEYTESTDANVHTRFSTKSTENMAFEAKEHQTENGGVKTEGEHYHEDARGEAEVEHRTESEKGETQGAEFEGEHRSESGEVNASRREHHTESEIATAEVEHHTENTGGEIKEHQTGSGGVETKGEHHDKDTGHEVEIENRTESEKEEGKYTEAEGEHHTGKEMVATEAEHTTENEGAEMKDHHTESGTVETEVNNKGAGVEGEDEHQTKSGDVKATGEHHTVSEVAESEIEHRTEHVATGVTEHHTKIGGFGAGGEQHTEITGGEVETEHHTENERGKGSYHSESRNDEAEQEHSTRNIWAGRKLHRTENGLESETEHFTESEKDFVEGEYHTVSEGGEVKATNDFLSQIDDIVQKLSSVDEGIHTAPSVLNTDENVLENHTQNDVKDETEGEHYTEHEGFATEHNAEGAEVEARTDFLSQVDDIAQKLSSDDEGINTAPSVLDTEENVLEINTQNDVKDETEGKHYTELEGLATEHNTEGAEVETTIDFLSQVGNIAQKLSSDDEGINTAPSVLNTEENVLDFNNQNDVKDETEGKHYTEHEGLATEHNTEGAEVETTIDFLSQVGDIAQKLSSDDEGINTAPTVLNTEEDKLEINTQRDVKDETEGTHYTEHEALATENNAEGAEVEATKDFLSQVGDIAQKLNSDDEGINTAPSVLDTEENILESSHQNNGKDEMEGKHYTEHEDVAGEHNTEGAEVTALNDFLSGTAGNAQKLSSVDESINTAPSVLNAEDETEGKHTEHEGPATEHNTEGAEVEATKNFLSQIDDIAQKLSSVDEGINTAPSVLNAEGETEGKHHTEHEGLTGEHDTEGAEGKTVNDFLSGSAGIAHELSSVDEGIDTVSTGLNTEKSFFENSIENNVNDEAEGKHTSYEGPPREHNTEGVEVKATNDFLSQIADVAQKLSSVDEGINTVPSVLDTEENILENSHQNNVKDETEGHHYTEHEGLATEHDTEGAEVKASNDFLSQIADVAQKLSSVDEGINTVPSVLDDEKNILENKSSDSDIEKDETGGKHYTEYEDLSKEHNTEGVEAKSTNDFLSEIVDIAQKLSSVDEDINTVASVLNTEKPIFESSIENDVEDETEGNHYTEYGGSATEQNTESIEAQATNDFLSKIADVVEKLSSDDEVINTASNVLNTEKNMFENSNQNDVKDETEEKHTEYEGLSGEHNTNIEGTETNEERRTEDEYEKSPTKSYSAEVEEKTGAESEVDHTENVGTEVEEHQTESEAVKTEGEHHFESSEGEIDLEHHTESGEIEGKYHTENGSSETEQEHHAENKIGEAEIHNHTEAAVAENEEHHTGSEDVEDEGEHSAENAGGDVEHQTENEKGEENHYTESHAVAEQELHTKNIWTGTKEDHTESGLKVGSKHRSESAGNLLVGEHSESWSSKTKEEHNTESKMSDTEVVHHTENVGAKDEEYTENEGVETKGEHHSGNKGSKVEHRTDNNFLTENQSEVEHSTKNIWAETELSNTESAVETEVNHYTESAGGVKGKHIKENADAEAREHQNSSKNKGSTKGFLSENADNNQKLGRHKEISNLPSVLHTTEKTRKNSKYQHSKKIEKQTVQPAAFHEGNENDFMDFPSHVTSTLCPICESATELSRPSETSVNPGQTFHEGMRNGHENYAATTKKTGKNSKHQHLKKTEKQTVPPTAFHEGNENDFMDFPSRVTSTLCPLCEEADEEQVEPIEEGAIMPSFPGNHETSTICELCKEVDEGTTGRANTKRLHGEVTKPQQKVTQRVTEKQRHGSHENKLHSSQAANVKLTSTTERMHHKEKSKTSTIKNKYQETPENNRWQPTRDYEKEFEEDRRTELLLATLTEQESASTTAFATTAVFKTTKSQHKNIQTEKTEEENEHYTGSEEWKLTTSIVEESVGAHIETSSMTETETSHHKSEFKEKEHDITSEKTESEVHTGSREEEKEMNTEAENKSGKVHGESQIEHEGITHQPEEHNTERARTEPNEEHVESEGEEKEKELKEHNTESYETERKHLEKGENKKLEHLKEDQNKKEGKADHHGEELEEHTETAGAGTEHTEKEETESEKLGSHEYEEQITHHEQTEHNIASEFTKAEHNTNGSAAVEEHTISEGTEGEENKAEEHHNEGEEQITSHEEKQTERNTENGVAEGELHTGSEELEEGNTKSGGVETEHMGTEKSEGGEVHKGSHEYEEQTTHYEGQTEHNAVSEVTKPEHNTNGGAEAEEHTINEGTEGEENKAVEHHNKGEEEEQITGHEEKQTEHNTENGVVEGEPHTGSVELEEGNTKSGVVETEHMGTEESGGGELHEGSHEYEEQTEHNTLSEVTKAEHNTNGSAEAEEHTINEGTEGEEHKAVEYHSEGQEEEQITGHEEEQTEHNTENGVAEGEPHTGSVELEEGNTKSGVTETEHVGAEESESGELHKESHEYEEQTEHNAGSEVTKAEHNTNGSAETEEHTINEGTEGGENKAVEHHNEGQEEEQITGHEEKQTEHNTENGVAEGEPHTGSVELEEGNTKSGVAEAEHMGTEESKSGELHKESHEYEEQTEHNAGSEVTKAEHNTNGSVEAEEHTINEGTEGEENKAVGHHNEGQEEEQITGHEEKQIEHNTENGVAEGEPHTGSVELEEGNTKSEVVETEHMGTEESESGELHKESHEYEEQTEHNAGSEVTKAEHNTNGSAEAEEHTINEGTEGEENKALGHHNEGQEEEQITGHEEKQTEHNTENGVAEGEPHTGSVELEEGNTKTGVAETEHMGTEENVGGELHTGSHEYEAQTGHNIVSEITKPEHNTNGGAEAEENTINEGTEGEENKAVKHHSESEEQITSPEEKQTERNTESGVAEGELHTGSVELAEGKKETGVAETEHMGTEESEGGELLTGSHEYEEQTEQSTENGVAEGEPHTGSVEAEEGNTESEGNETGVHYTATSEAGEHHTKSEAEENTEGGGAGTENVENEQTESDQLHKVSHEYEEQITHHEEQTEHNTVSEATKAEHNTNGSSESEAHTINEGTEGEENQAIEDHSEGEEQITSHEEKQTEHNTEHGIAEGELHSGSVELEEGNTESGSSEMEHVGTEESESGKLHTGSHENEEQIEHNTVSEVTKAEHNTNGSTEGEEHAINENTEGEENKAVEHHNESEGEEQITSHEEQQTESSTENGVAEGELHTGSVEAEEGNKESEATEVGAQHMETSEAGEHPTKSEAEENAEGGGAETEHEEKEKTESDKLHKGSHEYEEQVTHHEEQTEHNAVSEITKVEHNTNGNAEGEEHTINEGTEGEENKAFEHHNEDEEQITGHEEKQTEHNTENGTAEEEHHTGHKGAEGYEAEKHIEGGSTEVEELEGRTEGEEANGTKKTEHDKANQTGHIGITVHHEGKQGQEENFTESLATEAEGEHQTKSGGIEAEEQNTEHEGGEAEEGQHTKVVTGGSEAEEDHEKNVGSNTEEHTESENVETEEHKQAGEENVDHHEDQIDHEKMTSHPEEKQEEGTDHNTESSSIVTGEGNKEKEEQQNVEHYNENQTEQNALTNHEERHKGKGSEKPEHIERHTDIIELFSITEPETPEPSVIEKVGQTESRKPVVEFELSVAPEEEEELSTSEVSEKITRGKNTNKLNFSNAFKFSTTVMLLMSSVYGNESTLAPTSTSPKPRPSVYVDLPIFMPNTTMSSSTHRVLGETSSAPEVTKPPPDNAQCIVVYVNGPASLNGTKWNGHLENMNVNAGGASHSQVNEKKENNVAATIAPSIADRTTLVNYQTILGTNEKLEMPKFVVSNKCDRKDFGEKKDCVCAVDDLLSAVQHEEFNEGSGAKLECSSFLKLPDGIIIGNDSVAQIRKKRSFLFGKTCLPFKREVVDYSKGFFDDIFKIINTEFDVYALPGTEVIIPCLNKNEVIEFNKYMHYSWMFDNSVHISDKHIKQDEGNLVIEHVSANDSGNYTCTIKSKITDEHSNPEQNYHHQLVVVSTPIYKIKTKVIYALNESCTLTDGDVMNMYLPKILTGMLCGLTEKLCTVEVQRPNCIPGPTEHLLNVTFVVTMRTLHSIVPTVDNSKCRINCQMHLYAKLAGILVNNIEVLEKQPVTSEFNTRSFKFYPKKIEPHNRAKQGYWSAPPMLIITCPAGYGVEKAHPRVCVVCPKNTFSVGEESYCKMCPAGRYQTSPGSRNCIACSSPLENAACLRVLYSSTEYFKLYTGLAFGFLILTVVALFYLGQSKSSEEKAPVGRGANYVYRHGLRKTVDEEEGEPLLGYEPQPVKNPPRVPPPDF